MSPPLHELLGLWRGDESSTGYVHEGLAREICRKLRPSAVEDLLRQLYPPDGDVFDADARTIVQAAFKKWQDETKARRRAA